MPIRPSSWRVASFVAAAAVLGATPASAHPHVFIDYAVTAIFDDANVTGVRITWTFDQMYSSMLFHDYTSRPQGPLTAADVASLKKNAFEDTADFHYFTDINLNGKDLEVKTVTDFTARFDNHRMTYAFTVPIPADTPAARNTLEVDAFDHEFYIDFELVKKAAVTVEHGEKLGAACAPKKENMTTTIFGPVETLVAACTFSKAG